MTLIVSPCPDERPVDQMPYSSNRYLPSLEDALRRNPAHFQLDDAEHALGPATLVFSQDGGPVRTIATGRRIIPTGVYPSRKAGRPLPWESQYEQKFFYFSEVDTDVVTYRAQMFRIDFEEANRSYIVDCVRQLSTGQIEVIEVKKNKTLIGTIDYQQKLTAVRQVCRQLGWDFRLILGDRLQEPQWYYDAIFDIQSWRLTQYTSEDIYRVAHSVGPKGWMPMGLLAHDLGGAQVGAAKLKAMMIQRVVRLDLSSPLSASTPVSLLGNHKPNERSQ